MLINARMSIVQLTKQSGFSHVEAILLIIVVGAIGVIGTVFMNASRAATAVTNGKIYSGGYVFTPNLVPSATKTTFPASCGYGHAALNDVSPNGTTMASFCDIPVAGGKVNYGISTYTIGTGAGFKVLKNNGDRSSLGNGVAWQKTAQTGKNLQILTTRYKATTTGGYQVFTRYDSVTGAETVVKAGGTDNLIGSTSMANNPFYDWSADGKKISYIVVDTAAASSSAKISLKSCTIDLSVASPTRVCGTAKTVSGSYLFGLRWSEDMTKVAFNITTYPATGRAAAQNVYTANADLTNIKVLLKSASTSSTLYSTPVWSPNGLLLALRDGNIIKTVSASTGAVQKQYNDTTGYLYSQPSAWAKAQ